MLRGPIICDSCIHFVVGQWNMETLQPPLKVGTCSAFPDGIPDEIGVNGADHRVPFRGDHGIQWELRPTAKFALEIWEELAPVGRRGKK